MEKPKNVLISQEMHRVLKIISANTGKTVKQILEDCMDLILKKYEKETKGI